MTAPRFRRRCAVIGSPIAHSRSPFIHAAFAEACGIELDYVAILAPRDGFADTLARFADDGGTCCNVSMPFKFEAHALAARRTERAVLAGACNCLRRADDGSWDGDNTDGAGLIADIAGNAGVSLAGARVLLVGAGGAAAGVLGPLATSGAAAVVVANRTAARAETLVETLASRLVAHGRTATLRAASLDDCGSAFDVVVNATSSSVAGAPVPVDASVLRLGTLAVDLMYGAASAPFLVWARQHGAVPRDGLGMLVEQAADAFAFFHGPRPATARVLAALRTMTTRANDGARAPTASHPVR